MRSKKLLIARVLFAMYSLAVLYVLLIYERQFIRSNINLIPFRTVADYIQLLHGELINAGTVVKNLLGNLVLFLPMGFLLPFVSHRWNRFAIVLPTVLLTVLTFECLQLLLSVGSFDIDDILFGILGGCIGYALSKLPLPQSSAKKIAC